MIRISRYVLVAYAAVILLASLHPNPQRFAPTLTVDDLILHIIAYLILGLLAVFGFGTSIHRPIGALSFAVIASTCYGIVLEGLQSLTGRSPQLLDVVADVVGALIGALIGIAILALPRFRRSDRARYGDTDG